MAHLHLARSRPSAAGEGRQSPLRPHLRAGALTHVDSASPDSRFVAVRRYHDRGVATVVAFGPGPLTVPASPLELNLVDAVRGLHAAYRWTLEIALLVDGRWTSVQDAHDGLTQLVARQSEVAAINGFFSGGADGRACFVAMYRDGLVWTDRRADTEGWLLDAHGLGDLP